MKWVKEPNTTIRLGPNVVLDFDGVTNVTEENGKRTVHPLLDFGPCVTLTSVSALEPGTALTPHGSAPPTTSPPDATVERSGRLAAEPVGQARTPRSRGPVLKFGAHREEAKVFLGIRCFADVRANDGARVSGFRLEGPSHGQQLTEETGIEVLRCVDIQISNMEIAGWGQAAIHIEDEPGPDQGGPVGNPSNSSGGRISQSSDVKIFNNFIHHNQHPSESGYAAGYGVSIGHGAWAEISENVFDSNRHAITAAGDAGGYDALRNLVLKGGGYHGRVGNQYTHQFDVHGTGCWIWVSGVWYWSKDLCGDAGTRVLFRHNAFQYRTDYAIKIRGRPQEKIEIWENVFAHRHLHEAINLKTGENITLHPDITGPGNVTRTDTYGRYGVCDFDGDGVDDLFLATGQTWWYSSFGEFQWSFLSAQKELFGQVRFGYFDNDQRCDVLTERDGQWVIFSGGSGPPRSIGAFNAPLKEVRFGQFDPSQRDHRVPRQTTHAFKREKKLGEWQWQVTPLLKTDGTVLSKPDWQLVGGSSKPMSELLFGDFTGDGVTDVLAVVGGRWAISESARSPWDKKFNLHLGDDVSSLLIADLDNNGIDDIIKLKAKTRTVRSGLLSVTYTWWVSQDGRSKWGPLKEKGRPKEYTFYYLGTSHLLRSLPVLGFAGRFGAAPGGGVLLIGPDRIGRFFSEAEVAKGARPDWTSIFEY